jgi:hypothetical protein
MKPLFFRLGLSLAAISTASVADAQTGVPDVIVGKWRISNALPFACQALTWADEHTKFTFMQTVDGKFFVILESDEWHVAEDKKLAGIVSWDDSSQLVDLDASDNEGRGMLIITGDALFRNNFRNLRHFRIRIPLELDRTLSIDDADTVFGAFDKCLRIL